MSGMSNQAWRPHAVPGSIKPVYGAQYPPPKIASPYLQPGSNSLPLNASDSAGYTASMHLRTAPSSQKRVAQQKFANFQASVSDAWDADEDDVNLINARTAHLAADEVLARHAATVHHHQETIVKQTCN